MILFFFSRGKTQDNLFFRNVCKYTDFFVLFTVSAFRVEGNFYFSFFPGANGGIYGKVLEIGDYYIIMEVEGQNRLKIDKSAVIKDMTDATPAK